MLKSSLKISWALALSLHANAVVAQTPELPLPEPKKEASSPVAVPEALAVAPATGPEYKIADGSPVNIKEKGLTFTPPQGWEYTTNFPHSTMLVQSPIEAGAKYRRTIQITGFTDPFYFSPDEITAFEKELVSKFSSDSSVVSYRIRNHMPVELESGMKGHLFYSEFQANETDLMQMHVLVSSEEQHFLLTFTDLAPYFEVETAPAPHLNEAWAAVNSVTVERLPVSPMAPALNIFGLVMIAVATIVVAVIIRNRKRAKLYQDYAGEKDVTPTGGDEAPKTAFTRAPESVSPHNLRTVHETNLDPSEDDDYVREDHGLDFNEQKVKKAG